MIIEFELGLTFASAAVVTLCGVALAAYGVYRVGWWAGWRDAREGVESLIPEAYQRGKSDGWSDMSRALIRDMGPGAARQLADRMAAMDKVEAITGGKRT